MLRCNGGEVAYERKGDGPPLVLVHGGACDGRSWRPQLDGLAGELTVVAWDEPGAGRSSELPEGFGLADYADCLAALIEDLGLGPAHVGGISWGGTVLLELYRRHPDRVATLILVDTYAGWKGSLPEQEVRARVAHAREMVAAPPGEFDPTLPGLFAGDPPVEFVPLLEEMAAAVRPATLGHQLSLIAETDCRDVLPTIAVPTLLVWGELDVRSPLDVAREFERAIPSAELVVIPGAGHFVNLERPEAFNDAVRAFCRAHPPRRTWFPDELAYAGRENLDPEHVERYDGKEDADAAAEVALLQELGLTDSSVVLELGPGTGQFTVEVAPACAKVIAVDVSAPMLRRLQAKLAALAVANVEVVQAGFLSYAHTGQPVDVVYSRFALHHLPDFWKAVSLARLRRLLRPGGVVRLWDIVYDFEPADAEERIEAWCATAGDVVEGEWSRAELEEHVRNEHSTFTWLLEPMIERTGFEIVRRDYSPDGVFAKYVLRVLPG